ncbi:MAG: hypothetical protein MRZ91_03875, partial [Christensenellaceae bacterium]|nr:hypothetical protein [Christensenellaceae bacterium]
YSTFSTISVVYLAKTYAAKRRFLFRKNASRRKERIFRRFLTSANEVVLYALQASAREKGLKSRLFGN